MMKKKGYLIIVVFLIIIIGSNFDANITSLTTGVDAFITAITTLVTSSGSLYVSYSLSSVTVPSNGIVIPNNTKVSEHVTKVTGLTSGWAVNTSVYGSSTPSGFQAPNSTEVKNTLRYFSFDINASTAGGSYTIYFNVSQSNLNGVSPQNISLYRFETSNNTWVKLSTTVIDGTSDPAQFSATTTQLSNFVIGEETTAQSAEPSETPGTTSSAASGGGGGGSGVVTARGFKVLDGVIKVRTSQGQTADYFLKIANVGNEKLRLNLELNPVLDFIIIEDSIGKKTIDLEPLQTRVVNLKFLIPENLEPDIYATQLEIKGGSQKSTIPVIAEVKSKGPLVFDVELEVLESYKIVKPGEIVVGQLTLFNLGGVNRVDALLEYSIKDTKGNAVITETEAVAVETQLQKTREMKVPNYLAPGDYIFAVKATYNGQVATSSSIFNVSEGLQIPELIKGNSTLLIAILILLVIIIFLIYQYKLLRLFKENSGTRTLKDKLKHQSSILEHASRRGLVDKKEYIKNKINIDGNINKLSNRRLDENKIKRIEKDSTLINKIELKRDLFGFLNKKKKRQDLINLIKSVRKR